MINRNTDGYIISYTEAVNPVSSRKMHFVKKVYVWAWIILILFREHTFSSFGIVSVIVLIAIGLIISSKELNVQRVPSKMEICFSEDSFSIFREKHEYGRNYARQEYDEFPYKYVDACIYDAKNKKLIIKGTFYTKAYKYRKDGSLSEKPCYDRMETGLRYFYTYLDARDIVSEINEHSPIQVRIKE